jgi:response regulator NasT
MLRVLIAEDEWLVSFTLRHHLERCGYEVVGIAADGDEAVALCQAKRPDIVLMDIRMPLTNGIEATQRIMERAPTCVVMLTGDDQEACLELAEEKGAMAYLVKPVISEQLLPTMSAALKRFAEASSPRSAAAQF